MCYSVGASAGVLSTPGPFYSIGYHCDTTEESDLTLE